MRENKSELEKMADEILAEDTAKRGSGLTIRSPRPLKEQLVDDWAVFGGGAAHWDEYPSDAGPQVDKNIRSRFLEYAMTSLTERQRQAVELVVFGRMSCRLAGQELGLTSGTVHSYLKAALKKMRRVFAEDEIAAILFPELFDEQTGDEEE